MRCDDEWAWIDRALLALVIVVACGFASLMFADHLANEELLWRDVYHDRNSHLMRGLDYALALRSFDFGWFFSELNKAQVWPPFHGLFLSLVLLVGGIDHRLGILPSLIGWTMTVVCAWLIARRLFADRLQGMTAGAVAVTLTIASPAFRLLGADVMLEGLGSGLSALGVLLFMRACAKADDASRWRLLAVTLCLLFLHKMNYWGLVVAALVLTSLVDDWAGWRQRALQCFRAIDAAALRRALLHPLLIAGLLATALVIAILLRGPTAITLMGREVRLYPPGNPATIAYALLFFWGVSLWRRHRAALDAALGVPGRTMFYWHAVPVAIYFLLPQRLLAFLWFVGPYNNPGAGANPLNGAVAYWMGFAEGFHVSTWMAALVIVLVLVGAARAGRLPPGARAAFMLALLSFLAVIIHPQHQSRFLASWIFAVWVVAGFGAAVIAGWLAEAMGKPMRIVSASAIVAGVIAANALTTPSAAAYRHAIRPTEGATDIDLIRPYIQELDGVGSVMFVTTFGSSDLFRWVLHERCRCKMPVTSPWILGLTTREAVRQLMTQRVAETGADRIVVIDAPRSRYQLGALGWTYEVMVGAVDAMQQQTRFERIASHDLPDHGARVSIWRRRD